jgi:hypothetical protein
MELLILLLIIGAIAAFGLLANAFGVDSRPGFDDDRPRWI